MSVLNAPRLPPNGLAVPLPVMIGPLTYTIPMAGFPSFFSGPRKSWLQIFKKANGDEKSTSSSFLRPYFLSKSTSSPYFSLSIASRSCRCSTASIRPALLAASALNKPLSIQACTLAGSVFRPWAPAPVTPDLPSMTIPAVDPQPLLSRGAMARMAPIA